MNARQEIVITLRTSRFEERHLWATGLTANSGKIRALARNAVSSRRFGGALDLGVVSLWEWREKENQPVAHLSSAEVREEFGQIRTSLDRLTCASYIIELSDRMAPERQPAPELFKLLANSLSWLHETTEDIFQTQTARFLTLFLGKILQISGAQPGFQECRGCQTPLIHLPAESLVSPTTDYSGFNCANCRPHPDLKRSVIQAQLFDFWQSLGFTLKSALAQTPVTAQTTDRLFHWIELFIQHQVPELVSPELKSRPLVVDLLRQLK